MRQRDAKHTLRKSPFVRRTTPRSSGTVACWPTRVLLLCLYLVVFYYAFPKNARPSPSRLGFFRRFFRKGAKSREKQNIRSDVLLFSGTPDWSRTSGLTLRRTTNSLSYDSLTLHPALFCVNLAQCVFGFSRCFVSFCTVLRYWNTFRAISKKLADGIFELFKKTKLADY